MRQKLLLGTRKGLVVYRLKNGQWFFESRYFLGIPVSLAYVNPTDNKWWACLDHGHWGVKLHVSDDEGETWVELEAPKYPEGEEVKDGVPAFTKYLWAISNGGESNPNKMWIGTEPGGLFMSQNGNDTYELNRPLWDHHSRKEHWFGGGRDYAGIHSICIDPRDNDRIYIGISCAGVFETKDGGLSWTVRNNGLKADFLPDPRAEYGHDPHMLVQCQSNPDVLWQQNHCGIFRTEDGGLNWDDITSKEGPANFGFAVAASDTDSNQAWVAPAISDVTRVAVDQSLCICRSDDGGKTWNAFRDGLPQENCYDIVYRHALAVKDNWVCFGSTCGNLFVSQDYGESWTALSHFLPMIYSVHFTQN